MPIGIYKRTKKAKKNMALSHKGTKLTENHKINLSKVMKGKNTWMKGRKLSKKIRGKISLKSRGKKNGFYGKHHTTKTRKKWSEFRKGKQIGNKNPFWKGGITPTTALVRESWKYIEWRQKVFIRDDFTCQDCGQKGGYLEAHHKKSFSILMKEAIYFFPLLNIYDACMLYIPLWDLDNGQTLCQKCHNKTKKGRKKWKKQS